MTEPTWSHMFRVFLRIGILSFGGPAAQIAVMHKELVEDRGWLNERQFLSSLSFCMLLPGPEAMQLATYAGWRLRGVPGGLLAGLLFVLPGAAVMFALAAAYSIWGALPLAQSLFLGVKACVVIIVVQALLRVARKALIGRANWAIALLSFAGLFLLNVPFPAIILGAGLFGLATGTAVPSTASTPIASRPADILRTIAIWASLWLLPIVFLWFFGAAFLTDIALFFSKLAIVTFGGAYAVLAYMTQAMVQDYGWISTAQMMDGLGLAETTPGPLILVTQFVAFVAGHGLGGWPMAFAAAFVALWVTFIPCFLWIFLGAPYLEWISTRPRLENALAAITAAVVGVIANLALWFALHVLFDQLMPIKSGLFDLLIPVPASLNIRVVILSALAALMLLRWRWNLMMVLAIIPGIGLILQ